MSIEVHQAAETVKTSNELDLLFGPLFDEYFNGENQVVLKSSAVTTTDASNKRQQQPDSTSSTSTLATTVTANGNFDFFWDNKKDAQAVEILKLKQRVKKLERNRKSSISHPRRKIYRHVESSEDDLDEDDASKLGRKSDKTKLMFKDSDFDDLGHLVDEGMDFVQGKYTKVVKGCGNTEVVNTAGEGETEPVEKTKKKVQGDAQIERDAKIALRIQAKLDEELIVERERQEETFKVAIADMFDEVQSRIDVYYELAARMTQEEQEKYTIKERASHLKGKFYEEIQGLYERQQKRIQDFTPMDSEKEAQKPCKRLKRVAGSYAIQKSPKKSKVMKYAKDVTE
ncbi:hypothetical protein Tco_1085435 [Tanacetum coccineum]